MGRLEENKEVMRLAGKYLGEAGEKTLPLLPSQNETALFELYVLLDISKSLAVIADSVESK